MIRLKRSRAIQDIHPKFTGEELREKLLALAQARLSLGPKMKFSGLTGGWKDSKDALKRDSFGKCAYCEADTAVVAYGDVEHFRPKSKYWWLALCVDNYVYACQICNQDKKGNNFPYQGKPLKEPKLPKALPKTARARASLASRISPDPALVDDETVLQSWLGEDADLPHPYLEDPEPLFAWRPVHTNERMEITAPDNASPRSQRAVKAAIEYLGLNREALLLHRYMRFSDLTFAVKAWRFGGKRFKREGEDRIRSMCESGSAFAGMCRYFSRAAGFPVQ